MKKVFNTVKKAGPCLGEHDHPFIWTLLKSAQHQNETILQRRKMSWAVTEDVGERGPAINLNVFTWLHNIHAKKLFNTAKGARLCLGEHGPAISSTVFENFHIIQMRRVFNFVKWPGLCLGEHDYPFIWTLLKVCTTTKRDDSSTPRNELGRDKGCWGARLSRKLQCLTSRPNGSSTPWKKLNRVWGSTTQPSVQMFLKSFIPSR